VIDNRWEGSSILTQSCDDTVPTISVPETSKTFRYGGSARDDGKVPVTLDFKQDEHRRLGVVENGTNVELKSVGLT
jgi:hypothetical protein